MHDNRREETQVVQLCGINPETGQVRIVRYIAVYDVATIVNPKSLRAAILRAAQFASASTSCR